MKKLGQAQNSKKDLLFLLTFLFLLLLIPLGLEALLRLTNQGIDTQPFIHPKNYADVWIDNPISYQKYYPKIANREGMDLVKPNIFNTIKTPGVLRGFILGGSTAQGFPYLANQSFSKIAEASFRAGPQHFEILNLGRSAMSSYYVRDMAEKLLSYDPDFLVIYAGHNEYYGTISSSTGGNHFLKLLNLQLKEFRIFQLLFDILSPSALPLQEGQTRMAQQFSDRTFNPNEDFDKQTVQNFIDNLKAAAKPFLEKSLPIFIYLPVSNLEMPPFSSERQGTFQTDLQEAFKSLKNGDRPRFEALNRQINQSSGQNNAHRLYLEALAKTTPSTWDWTGLEKAKDRDTSPFRAKTALSLALTAWAKAEPGIILIDTPQFLTKEEKPFTKEIFIDHLHFNFQGQKLLGLALSRSLSEYYKTSADQNSKMENFYKTPGAPERAVFLTDYFSWRAITGVEKLLLAPPYQFMVLPGEFGLGNLKAGNPLFENPELRDGLSSVPPEDQFSKLLSWYSSTGQLDQLTSNLFALASTDRGNPQPPRMLAELFERSPDPIQKARAGEFYLKAYLLSGKDPTIFNRLRMVLQETGQNELYQSILRQYASP